LVRLVEQFVAVSFGQPTFCRLLQLFLRTEHPTEYRKLLFSELGNLLKQLGSPKPVFSSRQLFEPADSKVEILSVYERALIAEHVARSTTPEGCNVTYRMAIYHLGKWLFTDSSAGGGDRWLRTETLRRIALQVPDKRCLKDLIRWENMTHDQQWNTITAAGQEKLPPIAAALAAADAEVANAFASE